jgi:hypothetical protein
MRCIQPRGIKLPSAHPSFPPDRFEHAAAAYAYFHGREAGVNDIIRLMTKAPYLGPNDHLLGCEVGTMIRVIGVVSDGCTIMDTSTGPPTWASSRTAAEGSVRFHDRRAATRRERRLRLAQLRGAKLEALDILEAPQ